MAREVHTQTHARPAHRPRPRRPRASACRFFRRASGRGLSGRRAAGGPVKRAPPTRDLEPAVSLGDSVCPSVRGCHHGGRGQSGAPGLRSHHPVPAAHVRESAHPGMSRRLFLPRRRPVRSPPPSAPVGRLCVPGLHPLEMLPFSPVRNNFHGLAAPLGTSRDSPRTGRLPFRSQLPPWPSLAGDSSQLCFSFLILAGCHRGLPNPFLVAPLKLAFTSPHPVLLGEISQTREEK